MAFTFAPIVHIVAAVFAIIELGLTAYCTLRYLRNSPCLPTSTPSSRTQLILTNTLSRGESLQQLPRVRRDLAIKSELHDLQRRVVDPGTHLHRPDTLVHDIRIPPTSRSRPQRSDGHLLVRGIHRPGRVVRRAVRLSRGSSMPGGRGRHRVRLFPVGSLHLPGCRRRYRVAASPWPPRRHQQADRRLPCCISYPLTCGHHSLTVD